MVGAVVGLIVGAVGFFSLAPADGATGGGSSGVTVTTSQGAGGTEGEAAAAGQAATPEEQAVYDLAEVYNSQDCAAIVEATDAGFWVTAFDAADDEPEAGVTACEAYLASSDTPPGPAEVHRTYIVESVAGAPTETVRVAGMGSGWGFNLFTVHQVDGAWRVDGADFDHNLEEVGSAAESEAEERMNSNSGRELGPPTDPPTGNDTFDEIAQNCADGSMVACDDLFWLTPRGSDYELYGITCGGRRIGVYAGGQCELDFGRQVEDEEPAAEEGEGEGEGESSEGEGEGEGEDDAAPSPADGLDPQQVVEAWIAAGDEADCETMVGLYTERYLEGRTPEDFVADCEAAAAEAEASGQGPIPGLVVQSVDEQGDVADVWVTSTEITDLQMRITVAREGDVWLIDFIE